MSDDLLSDADLGIGGAPAAGGGDGLLSDADVGVSPGSWGKTAAQPFIGFNEGLAETLGAPVDLVNAGMRKIGLPASDHPFGGSESIKRGMGLIGANPDEQAAPDGTGEKILRSTGKGVAQAIGMEGMGAPIARGIASAAPRTAEAIEGLTGGGNSVTGSATNAAIGAGSGAGAETAASSDLVPDKYKDAARLAGGLAGGFGAAGIAMAPRAVGAGVDAAKNYMAPRTNPEQVAADTLRGSLSDPSAVQSRLDQGNFDLVPGSKPTLGQVTGDMGALSAEREAATRNPEQFTQRRADQNAARVDALQNVQPEGNPADVSKFLSQRLAQFDALAGAHEDAALSAGQGATDRALGAARTPEDIGASIRGGVSEGRAAAKTQERALWNAIDPDGTLALPATPVKSAAEKIAGDVSPTAKPVEGEEKAIYDVIGNLPTVAPFNDLTALRSRVSAAMRQEQRTAGNTPVYARLSQLRGSIEGVISSAAEHRAAQDAAAVQAGTMAPESALGARIRAGIDETLGGEKSGPDIGEGARATGTDGSPEGAGGTGSQGQNNGRSGNNAGDQGVPGALPQGGAQAGGLTRVYHPAGSFDVRHEVVDLPSLVTSHDTNFSVNPRYPANLQPRARESAPARDQVNGMAARLEPERLGPSPEANSGAPIVGPDNVVESGNGRTLAIAKAYQAGRAGDYRNWLESQGHDTTGMKSPVLIARRTSPMTDVEREQFAHSANTSSGLRMNAAEQAGSDAKLITPEAVSAIGDAPVNAPENRGFVRSLLSQIPAPERGGMLDAQGNLSQAGVRRVEAAVASRAYGDGEFISRAFDEADPKIRGLAGAMVDAAGPWMKMRQAARDGLIDSDHDVTHDVMNAARAVIRARDAGRPVAEVLHQGDMFGGEPSDLAKRLILNSDGSVASRPQIAQNLKTYAEEAQKNLAGPSLFGDTVKPADVLKSSLSKAGADASAAAPEQEFASKAMQPDHPPVNFDEGAKQRLKDASKATKERAQTFDQGPVGDTLRTRGSAGDFLLPDSAVGAKAFTPGPRGFETAQAFRKAASSDPAAIDAMGDYAAYLVRKTALDPATGMVDPKKLGNFQRQYGEALRAFPEVAAKFSDAAKATDAVSHVMAARREALENFQIGAIGKIIGASEPSEVTATVGKVFGQANKVAEMRRIAQEAAHDPDATQGLRKSIADYMEKRFLSNTEVGASGQTGIKSDQFQTFMRQNEQALAQVFKPNEIAGMRAIAEDLQRSQRTLQATRLPGQSNTAQDMIKQIEKASEHGHASLLMKLGMAAGAGYEAHGVTGALTGAGMAGMQHVAQSMRAAGLQKVDEIFREALMNPEFARVLLMKASKTPGRGSDVTLANAITRAVAYPELQRGPDRRDARASGGRVEKRDYPAKKASKLEKSAARELRKLGADLEPLMHEPDNVIVSALRIANRH